MSVKNLGGPSPLQPENMQATSNAQCIKMSCTALVRVASKQPPALDELGIRTTYAERYKVLGSPLRLDGRVL